VKAFRITLFLVAAAAIAFGWLAWKCVHDPKINFLPGDSRAEWIIFPAAPDARSHRVATMDATFRRTFTLDSQPGSARLLVRAAKRVELKINGETLQVNSSNWKQISMLDVSSFLRSDSNTIEARVFNDDAPPAFWLALTTDSSTLRTDGKWESSLAGSSWRNCTPASVPRYPRPGNLLAGGEKIFNVFPKVWRAWIVFGILAIVLTIAAGRWLDRNNSSGNGAIAHFSRRQIIILLGLCAVAWLILFWNNAKMLPFHCGYDSKDHVAYIKYIQDRGALPLPNEGFEMFQPPLYYALSAGVLSICRLSVGDDNAVIVLRSLTMIFGIANFVFVFLSLRLLLPNRLLLQLLGLLVAAFLPMQLYLSHYVTNETLAATLVTVAIYLGLRALKTGSGSVLQYLSLGICIGAAMLTKATSLLLIPPLIGALAMKLTQQRAAMFAWFRAFGITIGAIFVTCGWHYIRIWRHFGTPIVGNWDVALGFGWWQDPGFHTAGNYFHFGQSLTAPLFSGFNSFGDGVYSTLWGDGLGGGLSDMLSRTPWNYILVIGGYLLALIPTLLIVIGSVAVVYELIRRPTAEWFLLLGLSAAVMIALIFMTLRVASYAQVKAFYGLSAVAPLCAFAAIGWEKLGSTHRFLRFALATFLFFWAVNSYAAVWIRSSATQHIYAGRRLISEHRLDSAAVEAREAIKNEPSNATAQCFLAAILDDTGQIQEALEQTKLGIELDPTDGHCQLQMAINFARQHNVEQAMTQARHVTELEPENSRAYDVLFSCARQLRRTQEAIAIGRDALAVSPFDADLHYRMGLAAGEVGDFPSAAPQFAYALLLQPSRAEIAQKLHLTLTFAARAPSAPTQLTAIASAAPESPILLNELAWIFATDPDPAVRNGAEAVRQSEKASALTNRTRPDYLATLAAAYAEVGRFLEAIATVRDAISLARSKGDSKTAALAENLLSVFQANQPYREEPGS